jgi:hypothetical protein
VLRFTISFIGIAALNSGLIAADLFSGTWTEQRDQRKYDRRPPVISYEPHQGGI